MKISTFLVAGILGLALAVSCDGSSLTGDPGTGGSGGSASGGSASGGSGGMGGNGTGGNGGAGCQGMHYYSPGCNASPTCDNGTGGACFTMACGCNGKVLIGCRDYSEPFAYEISGNPFDGSDPAGMTCDPNADAGPQ